MNTVTKKDLIDVVADETNLPRAAVQRTVQSFLDNVIKQLSEGKRLEFRHFGVFEPRELAPRPAQNPRTKQPITIPARKTVRFKVGQLLREKLGGNGVNVENPAEVNLAVADDQVN